MKKAFVLLACLFAMQLTVSADDGTPIEVNNLPVKAQHFLKACFPDNTVPVLIKKHVAEKHPKQKIVKIERDRRGYEIKLDNGFELKFDTKFKLTGYDD